VRPPPPGGGSVEAFGAVVALKLLSLWGISKLDLVPVALGGSSVAYDPSCTIDELCFNLAPDGGLLPVPFCVCGGYCDTDDDMLALLLTELEKAEVRDVWCDCVPSVLESSEVLCRWSSKLMTGRIVEFIRFGTWREEGAEGEALPCVPLVVIRDMAELIVPSEARARVDRCGARMRSRSEDPECFVGVDSADGLLLAACAASVVGETDTIVSLKGSKSVLCS